MTDALAGRVKEKTVADIEVDRVISNVNKEFLADGEARLRVYDAIAEMLSGMANALRGPSKNLLKEIEIDD